MTKAKKAPRAKLVNGLNKRFDLSLAKAKREVSAVNRALAKGHPPTSKPGSTRQVSATAAAAAEIGTHRVAMTRRIGRPGEPGLWAQVHGLEPDWSLYETSRGNIQKYAIEHDTVAPSFTVGHVITLTSRPDNTFLFGAAGDLHAGSKYTRWDVREDLYRTFIEEGAQCSFDTGNWIDGECRFNTYDLEVHGLEQQCQHLAHHHPKGLKTYAVWGDDHEGWYVQREGIDMGRYNEATMRQAGHDWTDLGFMEAHVLLQNANSGKSVSMAVCHPGGGSAYALSYSIQKIIESLEGGEKPAVGLYGHYHKIWAGLIRNVWCFQTGCQQDQTPFMRKKRLEAHVGGGLIKLRQDPKTGAIVSMTPELVRYFNRGFHAGTGRWSRHGPVRQVRRRANQP